MVILHVEGSMSQAVDRELDGWNLFLMHSKLCWRVSQECNGRQTRGIQTPSLKWGSGEHGDDRGPVELPYRSRGVALVPLVTASFSTAAQEKKQKPNSPVMYELMWSCFIMLHHAFIFEGHAFK